MMNTTMIDDQGNRPGSTVTLMMFSEKPLNKMTVVELKGWLASKGAPTKGKKSELLDR